MAVHGIRHKFSAAFYTFSHADLFPSLSQNENGILCVDGSCGAIHIKTPSLSGAGAGRVEQNFYFFNFVDLFRATKLQQMSFFVV